MLREIDYTALKSVRSINLKLVCIFHSSSNVLCKLANYSAHTRNIFVSILHAFRGIAQVSETRVFEYIFIKFAS